MRRSPLFSGIFYIILGLLFTNLAINYVQREQSWGMFTYFLILIATFDIGAGLRMIALHFRIKSSQKKK